MGDSAFLEYRLHHYQLKFLRVEVQYEVIYDEQKAHGGWLMEMYTNDNINQIWLSMRLMA